MCKALAQWVVHLLFSPLRNKYNQRNGTCSSQRRVELPNDVILSLAKEMLRKGHTVTFHVKGYSMRPFLEHERDKVLLTAPEHLCVGDAVLAEISPGHYVLHRIICMGTDCVTLMGDGNIHGTEICKLTDIIGIVKQYIRPKRVINADNPSLCRKIFWWRKLLPIRRCLLFIYKEGML